MKGIAIFCAFFVLFISATALTAQERVNNYWYGSFSTSWGGGINWSLGHVPTASETAVIDEENIINYNPKVNSGSSYSCYGVDIGSNTSLTVQGTLTVSQYLLCDGHLTMNNELAVLNVYSLQFFEGSELTIPYPGTEINVGSMLWCDPGCDVNPDYGDFRFNGDFGQITINEDVGIYDLIIVGSNCGRWGGHYNVTKTNDAGNVLFVSATGGFIGAANENDPYGRVDWGTEIPAALSLSIEYFPATEQFRLLATFPYQGINYTFYESDTPEGPWDAISSGITENGASCMVSSIDPGKFFNVILWQE